MDVNNILYSTVIIWRCGGCFLVEAHVVLVLLVVLCHQFSSLDEMMFFVGRDDDCEKKRLEGGNRDGGETPPRFFKESKARAGKKERRQTQD